MSALREPLSDRELDVLTRAAHGLSNPAIGKQLWVTEQTVKFHMSNAIRKLGAENRQGATWRALELGIIEPPRLRTLETSVIRCHVCHARVKVAA